MVRWVGQFEELSFISWTVGSHGRVLTKSVIPDTVGTTRSGEARGIGSKRIRTRQNNGDRSLLSTLQGSSGQDSKGDTARRQ